jgi:hypothetical protein
MSISNHPPRPKLWRDRQSAPREGGPINNESAIDNQQNQQSIIAKPKMF